MIRNRSFMLGLGIGLIAGALLLQLMLIGQGSFNKLQTREEIERAAGLLNLKVVGEHEDLMTEEQWRALDKSGSALEPTGDVPPAPPESPSSPDSPLSPSAKNAGDDTGDKEVGKAEDLSVSAQGTYIEYRIKGGTTLSGVADGLLRVGVISDKDAFLKQANAEQINYTVRAGTYRFLEGEDYASIIKKLSPSRASKSNDK